MSPQHTNFTSEAGREAAGLCLDRGIPAVIDAPGDASAEMRPDASVTTQTGAFSEKEAAGPPVASKRSVLYLLWQYWRAFRTRRHVESLHNLTDRELTDIGLAAGEIDTLAARRAMERLRDSTTYLWP
jgi:uncharacterized protein YjiS (DUF1127 family)